MAITLDAVKLQTTTKVACLKPSAVGPDGKPVGTIEPYFENGQSIGGWLRGATPDSPNIFQGEAILPAEDYCNQRQAGFISYPAGTNVGFIIDVEIETGAYAIAFVDDGSSASKVTVSGRYTGTILAPAIVAGLGCGVQAKLGKVKVKEAFFFNADLYKYEDFLVDPVSKLVATASPGNDGPAFGNLVPSSEDFFSVDRKVAAYGNWNPLSRTANAGTAPNGNGNATRLTATGASQATYSKEFPVKPGKTYTYSAYIKGVSGTGQWTLVAVPGTAAREYITELHSTSIIPNSSTDWVRLSLTVTMPQNAALCQFVIQSGSGSGDQVFAWGEQVVEAPERGAYTQTNGVEIFASPLIGLQNGIKPPTGIAGIIGFATMIPDYGDYKIGSRLENIAWDGKFSTPIAWVCTASGNPGTWKAVYAFDSINSVSDPFFYSFPGAGGAWISVDPSGGTGTLTIGNGVLTAVKGTSSVIQLYGTFGNCPAAVPYELLTHEWNIAVGSIVVRLCDDGTTDTRRSAGVGSADYTVPATLANPTRKSVTLLFDAANVTATKMLVRPKYPFLNNIAASFSALPTQKVWNSQGGLYETWYYDNAVTYSAGALTFGAGGLIFENIKNLIPGKTYRIRYNVTANAGSTVNTFGLNILDASLSAFVTTVQCPGVVGINEVTFTVPANKPSSARMYFQVQIAQAVSINYIRLYSE